VTILHKESSKWKREELEADQRRKDSWEETRIITQVNEKSCRIPQLKEKKEEPRIIKPDGVASIGGER